MKHAQRPLRLPRLARYAALTGSLMVAGTAVAQPSSYPPGPPGGPPPSQQQGYYSQGQPPVGYVAPQPVSPFQPRRGMLIAGVGFGLGSMGNETGAIRCDGCETSPISFAGDVRLGGMLSDRFGLMIEGQIDSSIVQSYSSDGYEVDGTKSITQAAIFVAAQYHATPRLYIRGGIGIADLSFDYSDYYGQTNESIGSGTAVMGVLGYEVMSSRTLSLDIVGRLTVGTYDDIGDTVSAGSIGLAFNYY